jgi:hypothetical protein
VHLLPTIFTRNVLPAFAVMALGFVLDRALHVDKRSLSRLAVYILTPALAFNAIVTSSVSPGDFGLMLAYVVVMSLLMIALALAVGHALRWPQRSIDALVLCVAFLNSGNFGLSVLLFAYGDAGLQLGTVFYVGTNIAANTLGAYFASRGQGGIRSALRNVSRLPAPYAFAVALALRLLDVRVPDIALRPVALVAQATIPVMLLMLGVQLSQTRFAGRVREVSVAVALRLFVGAGIGALVAPLIGLQGLPRSVGIVQAAMPTAVSSGLLAIEFEADADMVSSAIFVSTLLSALTLTAVIALLGGAAL